MVAGDADRVTIERVGLPPGWMAAGDADGE